jgi:hypothetical protein
MTGENKHRLLVRLLHWFAGDRERAARPEIGADRSDPCDAPPDSPICHEQESEWTRGNAEVHMRRALAPGVIYGGYR